MNTMGSTADHRHGTPLGELPPPAPKAFFGREALTEEVVTLAEDFEPIALIGAGGIGKTSIALTVLQHDRIKDQFGDNRRFIRCDKFAPSLASFLAQLSKAIGAGFENPEDLTSLRPFLSSRRILIILDNAESIFDPEGTDSDEILAVVDELCQFDKICVCITSRITTVPAHCKCPEIPTLSMDAARDIFYGIYNGRGRSSSIDDLLERLGFHPLSITLLATTAHHNKWSYSRLVKEWNARHGQVLRTGTNKSLAASLQLSLDSPTFLKLGPDARDLLGVIAFFPQGINENHLEWLFPTISDIEPTLDKFCALSLTHRADDHITMLAPIRDHLAPQDPTSSPLLCSIKDHYFSQLSVYLYPGYPGFEEAQWIVSEDVNVEHFLNVLTSLNMDADDVWNACEGFVRHLYWHKPRKTVLGPKIEDLPDGHPSKREGLYQLSELFGMVGNHAERKRILAHVLILNREPEDRPKIALTLRRLSDANRWLRFFEEGIQQAREASEIYEELGDTVNQAVCLNDLALVLFEGGHVDDAETAALRAIGLLLEKGQESRLGESNRFLGRIYHSKGQKEKAIHHFETAISITSSLGWHYDLSWSHYHLADLFLYEGELDEANSHIEQAKSHAVNDAYVLGRAMEVQARIWEQQCRFGDAKSEILQALEILERLGVEGDAKRCRDLLQRLEEPGV